MILSRVKSKKYKQFKTIQRLTMFQSIPFRSQKKTICETKSAKLMKKNPQSVLCWSQEWHSLDASAQPCQKQPDLIYVSLLSDPPQSSQIWRNKQFLVQSSFCFYTYRLCMCNAASDSLMVRSISCHNVTYLFPFFAHSASDL